MYPSSWVAVVAQSWVAAVAQYCVVVVALRYWRQGHTFLQEV